MAAKLTFVPSLPRGLVRGEPLEAVTFSTQPLAPLGSSRVGNNDKRAAGPPTAPKDDRRAGGLSGCVLQDAG